MPRDQPLQIAGKSVRLSNQDKIFYPNTGFTKGEVIDYYLRVGPVLLEHLKGRALTLKRYPDGVEGGFFYEKQCPTHAPEWLKKTSVKKKEGGSICYCMINDLPSLLWAANIANLEFHPFLHRARAPRRPTALMFDLDPGPPANVIDCCRVALHLKALFAALGLKCFAKTSGSKGLQLVVPLNTPVSYRETKAFAHAVADALAQRFSDRVVSEMKKELRKGKVFIDWSQNDDAKTTVAPYSLRARERPSVSTPVTWEEVAAAAKDRKAKRLQFTPQAVLQRIAKHGDLYAPVLTLKQRLPATGAVKH